MRLKYNPFPLVFAFGDASIKLACLEFFGLNNSRYATECVVNIMKQQQPDGTFLSSLNHQQWGMREVVRNTLLLLKAGLPGHQANIMSAVQLILSQQRADGGWSENKTLKIPPEMVELSSTQSVTWLTADVVELLRKVGMAEERACKKAMTWLKKMQNEYGGWYCYSGAIGEQKKSKGDPDSTAQITFMMGEILGDDDPTYRRGRKLFEQWLDDYVEDVERGYWIRLRDGRKENLDVYHLTHLFMSSLVDVPRRFQKGYDCRDPRVKKIMEKLVDTQLEDGGWRPFWANESSPAYTVLALEVLISSGTVARDNHDSNIKTYVD